MRTQKNTVDYFPHEAAASDGDTLTIIEGLFGNDGYAFWFKLLEKLAHSENHYIDIHKNSKWQLFCSKAHITPEKALTIVEKLVGLEALDAELWRSGILWSDNLIKNIEPVYKNRRRELPTKPIVTDNRCPECGNLLVGMHSDSQFCSDNCRQINHRKKVSVTEKADNYKQPTAEKAITTSNNEIITSKEVITTSQSRVEKSRVEKSRVIIPDFIDKDLWADFMEMRQKKRIPNTDRAQQLLISRLTQFNKDGYEVNKIIEASIMRGWTGVFAHDDNKKGAVNGTHRGDNQKGQPRKPEDYTDPEELRKQAGW